eukprot:COSAG01_NODE_36912_length_511_cov_0.623786_1_plen_87_part_10
MLASYPATASFLDPHSASITQPCLAGIPVSMRVRPMTILTVDLLVALGALAGLYFLLPSAAGAGDREGIAEVLWVGTATFGLAMACT